MHRVSALVVLLSLSACYEADGRELDGGTGTGTDAALPDAGLPESCPVARGDVQSPLRVSEVMSSNDGAWLDERGESDDYIELVNTGDVAVDLADFQLRDASHPGAPLFHRTVAPGEAVVLWADEELDQGPLHLPFKLGSEGDAVELLDAATCGLVESVTLPALPLNESYARFSGEGATFQACPYASPGRVNPERCEPPAPPELPNDVHFAPYDFPADYLAAPAPLRITELALRPAGFVELLNAGPSTLTLAGYRLRVAPSVPGAAFPGAADGTLLAFPAATLAAGARLIVPVTSDDVAALTASAEFEGAVTLFDDEGHALDRADFMRWPEGAALTRRDEAEAPFGYCAEQTPGEVNTRCTPVATRDAGDRLRHLRVASDFKALAKGGTDVGSSSVKFIVQLAESGDDVVYLLGSEKWPLHYTFIRERIEGKAPLDRCDPEDAALFQQGWYEFSEKEYFKTEGRRFLLGTLVRYPSGVATVEFAAGDVISPAQMRRAFLAATRHTETPTGWALRPIDEGQLSRMREIEGTVPIVGPNAPFLGVTYQPLTQVVGYGELRFVRSDALETAELGPRVLVVTDAVPNDVPFVGGLVTEAFQTPLAHVNVLSRARGTPNMALRHARDDARLAPLFGKLVRLEVGPDDFDVRAASPQEADAFWQSREPTGPATVPPRDTSLRGVITLNGRGHEDLPALGAKAAQFAELYRVDKARARCSPTTVPLHVPKGGLGVPVVHYVEHFEASGAADKLAALRADPAFRADPAVHAAGLKAVRDLMLAHPVDHELLASVEAAVRKNFGSARVRFRSSSNTEDLPTFNGAGLHTSTSAEVDSKDLDVADALRTVWSSLWNTRAYDEREAAHIDQEAAAMGVLIHAAHRGEAAQGVAISRNFMHVTRAGTYYINAQRGEASVTNPAPGVATEQILFTFPPRTPMVEVLSRSSLTGGEAVLSQNGIERVACAVGAVHEHFRPLLDPMQTNQLFAMQIEWKLMRDGELIVKQARPQPFADVDVPQDCREF